MRIVYAILLAFLARPAAAQDILTALRTQNWPLASADAAGFADPVAGKLVTYFRLLTPNAATATELTAFLTDSPDWPNQALLLRRRDEALTLEPDDATALAACAKIPPLTAPAQLRCADTLANQGRPATELARHAWIGGLTDPASELHFLQRFGAIVTPDDEWRRFTRLAETDNPAASRQLLRLDAAHRQAGETILALRHADPRAVTMIQSLALPRDPFVILEEARYFRKTGQDDAALAAWQTFPAHALTGVEPDRRPAFWTERTILARHRLRDGDAAGAYALAAAHGQTDPETAADAEFLAGFIALRRLNSPAQARPHFQTLATLSDAVITQARAHYWLGRSATNKAEATREFAIAATWPTTYYGQLAALAAGETAKSLADRIARLRDPTWEATQAIDFASREVARAAGLLISWGDPDHARAFLLRLEDLAPDPAGRAMAARFAMGLGLPDQAITIARRAGRDGVMLPDIGWPAPYEPPGTAIEPALALGLIRQESNFAPAAVSPAGARGLMQLMPATATLVAHQLGTRADVSRLLTDPATNMRLGTAYMQNLMAEFGDFMPMAIAAYNAGPGRAATWAAENGDPRSTAIDPIDWIELIPFNETRNYVQRVIENVVLYRARRGIVAEHPVIPPVQPALPTATATNISPPG
jgi:soluble lytic murein transglycosylase